jgi:hypothetical protein
MSEQRWKLIWAHGEASFYVGNALSIQALKYLLKKSIVRCQASFALASS